MSFRFKNNKLENNAELSNKKSLFLNMKAHYESTDRDPFATLPLTYLIRDGIRDVAYKEFESFYFKNPDTTWIVKPGENTNRGQGITVVKDIKDI